jgi:short-subunit dehydrogenase
MFVCDITNRDQVFAMTAEVEENLGRIDVLVNNAGVIKVGPFSEMSLEDFQDAMNVMFWGTLHMTLAVLPQMRARAQGSVVNITSIGGKVSLPHLVPYSCAKFAAVALSEGLRAELASSGVRVTTIVPGLMRTGSHLNAEFKGRQAAEYAWFAAAAASPLISIAAERAARSIVRATVHGDGEKILSVPADAVCRLNGLVPGVVGQVLTTANRILPSEKGAVGETMKGASVENEITSNLWKVITTPGRRAAASLNELPPGETT